MKIYKPTYRENVAGVILDWVDKNEETGMLKVIFPGLDIAELAAKIDKLKHGR